MALRLSFERVFRGTCRAAGWAVFSMAAVAASAQELPIAGQTQELPIAGQEPVLGLRFPVGRVQFEPLPADVLKACPAALAVEGRERSGWLLAQAQEGGHRYVALGGFLMPRGGGAAQVETDLRGAVVDMTSAGCELLGPARRVFDAPPPALPAAALEQLAADLARRYAQAFGSADGLQAVMRRQRLTPAADASPVLHKALGVVDGGMVPVR
ncbi:hypothetical protein [Azohydromonas lata]|uniref:hypothetical protein n=1 Tax=Azohydromonas lata TaxID=45677 RepID=UPI0008358174|nr:hypothetical protein [Azohydromonas lata]